MIEIKVVLSILLQRYRISVVQNSKISPNMMMRPIKGMPVRIYNQDWTFKRVPVRGTINNLIDF